MANSRQPDAFGDKINLEPLNDPAKNPEHIGNIPAGHQRDEENLRRTDALAEQVAAAAENSGSIDPAALSKARIENEIAQHFEPTAFSHQGNPMSYSLIVRNPRSDRAYCWVKYRDRGDGSAATVMEMYSARGWMPVPGESQECPNRARSVENRICVGDVQLWYMPVELHDQWEAAGAEQNRQKQGDLAEESFEAKGEEMARRSPYFKGRNLAHGRRDDELLRSTILRGEAGQGVRIPIGAASSVNRMLKEGTVPGLRPGFDRGGR